MMGSVSAGRLLLLVIPAGGLTACAEPAMPTIPEGAQQVRVSTANEFVRVAPNRVGAGEVWFVFEPDPATQHVDAVFVHRGAPDSDPEPLSEEEIARLRLDLVPADVTGLTYESGFGPVFQTNLVAGSYVFMVAGPDGPQPGEPPISIAVLEVTP